MFGIANFDALAQANDFRIERRQVVFLCYHVITCNQRARSDSLRPRQNDRHFADDFCFFQIYFFCLNFEYNSIEIYTFGEMNDNSALVKVVGRYKQTIHPTPRIPQHRDVSFQSTLDRRPMYYSQKMDQWSLNANSIM